MVPREVGRMDSVSIPRARTVARVLVLSDDNQLLLLRGKDIGEVPWWVSPGGVLKGEEDFASAAREGANRLAARAHVRPVLPPRRTVSR